MFTIALSITTLGFACVGLILFLECRDRDHVLDHYEDRIVKLTQKLARAEHGWHNEATDKQRFIIKNRLLTASVQDMTRERRALVFQLDQLLSQHEQLQVDHAKAVLGGTMLPADGRGQE